MLVIELFIDVREIMGANVVNTICEHVAPMIIAITGGKLGIKILSNLCTDRRAFCQFKIPVKSMKWKNSTVKKKIAFIIKFLKMQEIVN